MHIDLNADVGESFGPWRMGEDETLLQSVTSANIACGFHAGDATVIRRTLRLAAQHGVAVGAHPGFPDLNGFGRRELQVAPQEIEDLVLYQLAAIAGMARAESIEVQHVKAHGALYNMAMRDRALADAVARAVASFDRSLWVFALPRSALHDAADAIGLRVAAEGFADRAYESDGSLTPRTEPGSVLHDPVAVAARGVTIARDHTVVTRSGDVIPMSVDTLCLHGDAPGATVLARGLRSALEDAGVQIRAVGVAPDVKD